MSENVLRLALPSNDRLAGDTLELLAACGIHIPRRGRQGLAETVRGVPNTEAVFLRPDDIPGIVAEGGAQLGITGRDWLEEKRLQGLDGVTEVINDLGFGHGRLMLAAPSRRVADNGNGATDDLARWAREEGRDLRAATKYPALTHQYLEAHGVNGARVREFQGSHELLPKLGAADLIADIVVTGATLESHALTPLQLGSPPVPILRTSAALIACTDERRYDSGAADSARLVLEYIHANRNADGRYVVMANVPGETAEDVARKLFANVSMRDLGLKGPTIAPVFTRENLDGGNAERWFSVTFVIKHEDTEQFVVTDSLRAVGARDVVAFPITQHFGDPPNLPVS